MNHPIGHNFVYRFHPGLNYCEIAGRSARSTKNTPKILALSRFVEGYTFIELLVTLSISAVILALAVPTFDSLIQRSRFTTHANAYITSLHLARSEATRRNGRVALCKTADGASCTTSGFWNQGWLVFQDANNNAQVDTGEEILRVHEAISAPLLLKGNSLVANYVSYSSMGYTRQTSGALQAGTLTLCNPASNNGEARELVISATGRPRVQTTTVASCP